MWNKFIENILEEWWKKYFSLVKDNLTFITLIIAVSFLAGFYFGGKSSMTSVQQQASVTQNIDLNESSLSSEELGRKGICEGGKFSEKIDDWKIRQYNNPDNEGFYCPRMTSSFSSPDIWYKNPIPTNFEFIEFRYQLKDKDMDDDIPPSFIFSVGEEPRILRFYIPENNYQLVGFERIELEESKYILEREIPQELSEPIDTAVETELRVRMVIGEGNKVSLYFNPTYLSILDEDSTEDSFSYTINLLDPKPISEHSEIRIGFGTFKGNCIKPISYKFCY